MDNSVLLRMIGVLQCESLTELKQSSYRLRICSATDIPLLGECVGSKEDATFLLLDGNTPQETLIPTITPITRLPSEMDVFSPDCHQQVEGSPLETKFLDLVMSPTDEVLVSGGAIDSDLFKVEPIPTGEATQLIADFTKAARQQGLETPFVWIVCLAGDPQSTAMIGRRVRKETEVESCTVMCPDNMVTKHSLPSLSDYKNKMKFAKTLMVSAFSRFDVILPNPQNGPTDISESNFVYVAARWDSVSAILQNPPVATSTLTITLSPGWGDPRSPIDSVFKELILLETLNIGLETGEITWPSAPGESAAALQLRTIKLIESTKRAMYIQDQVQPDVKETESVSTDSTLATTLRFKVMPVRNDLDFTERLWLILKDCQSYNELVSCLKGVLKSLAAGDVQPMVHRQNNTKLARMIRDSYDGNMEMPRLDGMLPLEILVELGIEKLRRDYISVFCGSDRQLVTLSVLEPLITTDKTIPLTTKIGFLKKLHLSLEGVSLCQTVLGMSEQQQSTYLRTFLTHYLTADAKPHEFTFTLSASVLPKLCERWMASSWQLNMSAMENGRVTRALKVNLSVKPKFSHVKVGRMSKGSESEEDIKYHLTLVQSSLVSLARGSTRL